jgi:hypothetical protein
MPSTGPITAEVRRGVQQLLTGAVDDDDALYLKGLRTLLDGLELDPAQRVAVSDRLMALASTSRVLIRGLCPPSATFDLAKMIDLTTEQLARRVGSGG